MSNDKILVEVSAHHIHLTQENVDILFGKGYQLSCKKELSQPGQFVCNEKVTVKGPKGEMKMSCMGPCRSFNQVEVSLTDARALGITAMIRETGHVEGTNGCTIIGPEGSIDLAEGVIAAKRHIHLTTADAAKYGIKNGDIVSVKLDTADRSLTFGDVVCRVSDKFALAMHIDTDEGNAACVPGSCQGEIIK